MAISRWYHLPNLLSLSRIAMVPFVAHFLSKEDPVSMLVCLGIVALAGITDGLDGYVARRMGLVGRLGIALDPIADKVFALAVIVLLVVYREFPVWLAAVILGRDVIILVLGAILMRGRPISLPSNLTGKYTFSVIVVLIASHIIRYPYGIAMTTFLVVPLILFSGVSYFRTYRTLSRGGAAPVFRDTPAYKWARTMVTWGLSLWYLWKLYQFVR